MEVAIITVKCHSMTNKVNSVFIQTKFPVKVLSNISTRLPKSDTDNRTSALRNQLLCCNSLQINSIMCFRILLIVFLNVAEELSSTTFLKNTHKRRFEGLHWSCWHLLNLYGIIKTVKMASKCKKQKKKSVNQLCEKACTLPLTKT